jgi:ATP-dependent Clp protease ATP-binding subunit ClpX
MIPEFIGRLPIITSTHMLTESDLSRVLTEPRNCLVRQYQHLFELDGVDLDFTPGALLAVAAQANSRGTGARGLASIMEKTLSDLMFEMPSRTDVARVVITREMVEGSGDPELYAEGEGPDAVRIA